MIWGCIRMWRACRCWGEEERRRYGRQWRYRVRRGLWRAVGRRKVSNGGRGRGLRSNRDSLWLHVRLQRSDGGCTCAELHYLVQLWNQESTWHYTWTSRLLITKLVNCNCYDHLYDQCAIPISISKSCTWFPRTGSNGCSRSTNPLKNNRNSSLSTDRVLIDTDRWSPKRHRNTSLFLPTVTDCTYFCSWPIMVRWHTILFSALIPSPKACVTFEKYLRIWHQPANLHYVGFLLPTEARQPSGPQFVHFARQAAMGSTKVFYLFPACQRMPIDTTWRRHHKMSRFTKRRNPQRLYPWRRLLCRRYLVFCIYDVNIHLRPPVLPVRGRVILNVLSFLGR